MTSDISSADAGIEVDLGGEPFVDLDGDGISAEDGDCDDQNNLIYPGARERSMALPHSER